MSPRPPGSFRGGVAGESEDAAAAAVELFNTVVVGAEAITFAVVAVVPAVVKRVSGLLYACKNPRRPPEPLEATRGT